MTKRILLTAVVAAAIFVCCDSLNMIELDSATESASLIEAVRAYYETAIQPNGLNGQFGGKISGDSTRAAVLAEMVRQYPPDWSQAVAWRDGGEYHVATIIGADKPAVSFSHDSIAVVRTLVADLDGNGEVVGGRLVEFISPDPLDASLFQDYAKQWLTGDFDDTKMLAAEYTTGYAHQQAYLHAPSESVPVPVNMSLEEVCTPGKGQGIEVVIACWTTDIIED